MENTTLDSLSEKLSPVEIKNKEFKKGVLGYSPGEVVAFLDKIAKTWEAVQRREKDLQEHIQSLQGEIKRWQAREGELTQLRVDAMKEADKIKQETLKEAERVFAQVEDRANHIRVKTEEWLTDVINQVQETERQKNNFVNAFRSALDSHYELIKTDQELAEPLSSRLDTLLKSVMSSTTSH